MVIRAGPDRSLQVAELTEFEEPKKFDGGNSKIR